MPSPCRTLRPSTSRRTLYPVLFGILLSLLWRCAAVVQGAAAPRSAVSQAQSALESGNPDAAIHVLSPWLEKEPRDTTARVLLGKAYEIKGDFARAQAQFRLALKAKPESPEALAALGTLYAGLGHPEKAEPFLARAAAHSRDFQARLSWAAILAKLHRYREAAEALRGTHAPQARDERIAYFRLKASVELGNGNAQSAVQDMKLALALSPEDRNLCVGTAIAEMQAREWNSAVRILEPVFKSTQNPQIGFYVLEAQINARASYAPTLQKLRSLPLPDKQDWVFRQELGELLLRSGLDAEAVQDLEQAVKGAPENGSLYAELAFAQFRASEPDAALASAMHARSLQEGAAVESLIGDIQEERGASLDAAHSYQRALALEPENQQYWLSLAFELLRHQTYKPALAVLEEAAKKFPESPRIRIAIGLTQYFLEDYHAAIRSLLDASQLNPEPRLAVDYLGQLQLEQPVTPEPDAVDTVCKYADIHPKRAGEVAYCGALIARMERDHGDARPSPGVLQRLRTASRVAPENATAACELGKALEWADLWLQARTQMQACVRLEPSSAEAHYRLAQVYLRFGQTELARREMRLHDQAVRQMAVTNAQRDATLEKFLYTMRGRAVPPH
jgi:tetratricopeptide (TPR) repeat protein